MVHLIFAFFMSSFFHIILFLVVIVFLITLVSLVIEMTELKGYGKFIGFLYSGLPFLLGIIVFILGDMILNTVRGTHFHFYIGTIILWVLSILLAIYPLFILKPKEHAVKRNSRKLLTFKEIFLRFMLYFELVIASMIILIPVIWVIGASFSPKGGIGWHIWPDQLSLHQYKELLYNKVTGTNRPKYEFVNWYKNTLFVAIVTCIFSVIFITMVAYVFARFKFKGKKFGLLSILILQMFPSFMGLIALYNLFVTFGLNNHPLALTFVYVAGAIPYNVWLVKGFLQNIPKSLDESAMIDGANKLQIFTKIIFPLSSPIITFLAISMFMSPWMDFMLPRMVISTTNKQTLAIGLYNLINGKAQQFTLFAAGALMVALPITILYTLLQRYLIEGITAGANKG